MGTLRTILGAGLALAIVSQVIAGFGGSKASRAAPEAQAIPSTSPPSSSASPPAKPYVTAEERNSILAAATKKLKRSRDEMEKTTFYTSPGANTLRTQVGAYIGLADGGQPYLRMMVMYHGSRWIFYDHIKIMADDQIVYQRTYRRSEIKRDNEARSVWEVADYVAQPDDLASLQAISAAKSVTVRFAGRDRIYDHKMTTAEKSGLTSVLKAYDHLHTRL